MKNSIIEESLHKAMDYSRNSELVKNFVFNISFEQL